MSVSCVTILLQGDNVHKQCPFRSPLKAFVTQLQYIN
jgi:hypothetical protein